MWFVQRMYRKIRGTYWYTCQKPQRQVLEQPIRAKFLSIQQIRRDPKPIINGFPRFSRAFHRLDDFTFPFVNHKTLGPVIGRVISVIGFLSASLFAFESAQRKNKPMYSTCPNRSNHLLQNARVPKFSLMTFRSCLALGNLVIIVHGYNL